MAGVAEPAIRQKRVQFTPVSSPLEDMEAQISEEDKKSADCDEASHIIVPVASSTGTVSPSPTPPLERLTSNDRTILGRKRNSEWVFRPLKLKFKVKELEELYRNYVYKQQQNLLFTACLILVALSLMVVLSFLINGKVRGGTSGERERRREGGE